MILEIFNMFTITVVERVSLRGNLIEQFQEIGLITGCDALLLLVMVSYPVQVFARQLPLIQSL
jgi:hypothetical protein